ncbi:hypothetical protein ACFPVV_06355 [Macrococcoides bohemicum]|uniref:SGNH/GDSL hydrolase family protein n=1 Tax=Macrococcoides bohemicum TaxID=1903056 RepID=A0A328A304_9STAP|nr:hypothetical protein [Macrococcus bohemicus]RAK48862.1 hypothetical protein BHX94_09435 [Macrococcus bohemicus]
MKNLLFWIYIVLAVILIAVGYTFWETRVTDSEAREKAISEQSDKDYYAEQDNKTKKEVKKDTNKKPNTNLFKKKTFQSIYNNAVKDKKVMNITLVSTPYQTSDENTTVKDELAYASDDHIKVNEVEVSGSSSTVSIEKINKTKPDLVILDALTLNDFYENVSSNDHIAKIESIYSAAGNDNTPVVIIGTRPEYNDSNFAKYQKAEADYFGSQSNEFFYVNQSNKWPNNKAIEDYYNVDDGLLTDRGVTRWVTSISDYLFNDKVE